MSLTENINPLEIKKINWLRVGSYLAGLFFIITFAVGLGVVSYWHAFDGKVYPGVYIGSEYVGNKNFDEVKILLENFNDKLFVDGLSVVLPENNKIVNLDLTADSSPDNVVELMQIDVDETMKKVAAVGRDGDWLENILAPLYYRFVGQQFSATVTADEGAVMKSLETKMAPYAVAPNDANIKITQANPLNFEIVEEKTGHIFDYQQLVNGINKNIARLSSLPVAAQERVVVPVVRTTDLPDVNQELPKILAHGDIELNYVDGQTKIRLDWKVKKEVYVKWVEVQKDGDKFVFGLNRDSVETYLETLQKEVNRPAVDAKFSMENEKVKEFQASRTGVAIDLDQTYEELNKVFLERNYYPKTLTKTVSLVVKIVEPQVYLADVNDLGVSDIIGVGESTFYGSHFYRIKNIGNAVARLNGYIIKPGEEFSTIKAAGPFITENGYFPELVIKGDKILKEVGGGMCQIGTTLFRTAMNSGMPITERRNHSLVVNYYFDPVNHNPGTDATVYDPVVDFKFLNDTGNYLLLQTAVNYETQKLTFTLWGKSDGRKGSYTHPLVSRWIPAGATQTIEVDDLKPGVKDCQGAYMGAVTSFVYTRITSSTEEIKQVFSSYYRPLANICRIGKQPDSTCPVGKSCSVDTSVTVAVPVSADVVVE